MPSTDWLRSHSASVVSPIGALEAMPALETTMSTPPNASTAAAKASATALLGGDVAADRDAAARRAPRPRPRRRRRRGRRRPRTRPAPLSAADDGAADPAGGAGDERDLALELARRRRQRELVELERPVLDGEALGLGQRDELRRPRWRPPSPRSRGDRGRGRCAPPWASVPTATSPTFSIRTTRGSGSDMTSRVGGVALEVAPRSRGGTRRRCRRAARAACRRSSLAGS